MSELINKNDNRATIRWKLLTGVSALALTAYVSSTPLAKAEDSGAPQVWIELGTELNHLDEGEQIIAPDFLSMRPSIFSQPQSIEKPPIFGFDEFGQISFQPDDSNWVFSASIRYGRALKDRHRHQQTYPSPIIFNFYPSRPATVNAFGHQTRVPKRARFADTSVRDSERHLLLDFQAGKDVGLGMFGKDTKSTVSLGVRFAQFRAKANISLKSDPDWHFQHRYFSFYGYNLQTVVQPYHSNVAGLNANRSFRGVGPSLSWSGSTPFAGTTEDGELAIDWGLSAAVLFGRQKTRTQHHTTGRYHSGGLGLLLYASPGKISTPTHIAPPPQSRSRNVTVPNVGGFVGLSYRYTDAKLSIGYRYDTFLNAMDTGIDARKTSNLTFNGPYASISVGLGD